MDLLARVTSEFNVDEKTASKALGAIFTSVRMAMDTRTFGKVALTFPDAAAWMREAPVTGGRTGEMLALATPATLKRSLITLGFDESQVTKLGAMLGNTLREALPPEIHRRIAERLPLLEV